MLNEVKNDFAPQRRPGKLLDIAFENAGWQYEGTHKDWTKHLEDVNVYAHVWLEDGFPTLDTNTQATLVASGDYVTGEGDTKAKGWGVKYYQGKNIELYKKDRDYYTRRDNKSFAEHIQLAVDYVEKQDNVTIDREWRGAAK